MSRAAEHLSPTSAAGTRSSGVAARLREHLRVLQGCTACPQMIGPVITGQPAASKVLLIGQAPGQHEGRFGRPFAWTAGKTMFGWFESIGLSEDAFRQRVYMAAVCRCFPGKNPKGGDRVPSPDEIAQCRGWLESEVNMLEPELIIPVGKLAIAQVMPDTRKLIDVVGTVHRLDLFGHEVDVIALPHPSGASTWHRTEPGKTLLAKALALIEKHPAFHRLTRSGASS